MVWFGNQIRRFYGQKVQIIPKKADPSNARSNAGFQKVTILQKSAYFWFDKKMIN
jgi:hypothetical protein